MDFIDLRKFLISLAKQKKIITYKETKKEFKLEHMVTLFNPLGQVSGDCIKRREPLLSALVVGEDGLPGQGFWDNKTREYLSYWESTTGSETKQAHQKELNRIFDWKW